MPSATANAPNLTGYFKLDGTRTITGPVVITPAANVVGLTLSGASLTGANAQALVSLAGTWNTSGTPTALLLNITNTASNAASKLIDLQTGGVSRLAVTAGGNVGIGMAIPTVRLEIAGSADATQFIVRANSVQSNSNPLVKLLSSAGTELLRLHSDNTNNLFLGTDAGRVNNVSGVGNAGLFNTFIGAGAGYSNTSAQHNSAQGNQALRLNTTGNNNTAQGSVALYSNTIGYNNTAQGLTALYDNTTGYGNTALGMQALRLNTTGFQNTANGFDAGRNITTGSNNTFLGSSAGSNASQLATAINSMALGNGAFTTASNQVVVGNTSVTQTLLNGKVGIGVTVAATALDVVGTTAAQFRLRNVITDVTTKTGQVQVGHYNNAEEDFALLGGTSAFGVNTLNLGGGSSALNTATSIVLYTAANEITLTGTARLTLDSAGLFTLWDGGNFALGTTTGTKIGTATTQKLGFFNATPVVRPVLATGAGATADNIITVLQNLGLVGQT